MIQVAAVRWFRSQYPARLIYAVPNGGHRNAVVAAKLKAEGVLPGVPDLFVAASSGGHHGLYVEMKAEKNKPTQAQRDVMEALTVQGYACAVCYSLDEFIAVVVEYFGEK